MHELRKGLGGVEGNLKFWKRASKQERSKQFSPLPLLLLKIKLFICIFPLLLGVGCVALAVETGIAVGKKQKRT